MTLTARTSERATADRAERLQARLRSDVERLASFDRRTAGDGERRSGEWIAGRLREIGADDVQMRPFRTQSSWTPAHLAHAAMSVLASRLDGPVARAASAAIAASYELEVSGRSHWVRRVLPAGTGVSVQARFPSTGPPSRTLVLVAHHDAAQTGLVWHPRFVAANRSRSRRTGRSTPSHAASLAAMVLAIASPRPVRRIAEKLLMVGALLMVESQRSATAPGANDNASGVAAVLELARRLRQAPLPDTDVVLVFPGGEEAGNTGMLAWARAARSRLETANTLVVNLDAVGSGGYLVVARREGLTGRLPGDDADFALGVAEKHGIDLRPIVLPNISDAVIAARLGVRVISVLSYVDGWISNLHRPSDTPGNLGWNTVVDAVTLTEHLVEAWRSEAADDA